MKISSSNNRILVVDDMENIRSDFAKLFSDGQVENKELDALENILFNKSPNKKSEDVLVERNKYVLDFATSGEGAVNKVKESLSVQKPYAAIFMDIRMPGKLDGVEASVEILKIDPKVQIILCSAYTDYDLSGLQNKFGVTDGLFFIRKPFEPIVILQIASSVVRKWNLTRENEYYTKNLEQIVESRSKQLIHVNKIKFLGELLDGMIIQVSSPLNTLSMLCENIRNNLSKVPVNVEGSLTKLNYMSKAVSEVQSSFSRFVEFSQNQYDEQMGTYKVSQILDHIYQLFEEKFKTNGIGFSITGKSDVEIQCAQLQIEEAIIRLVSNSIESIQDSSSPWIRMHVESTDVTTQISIIDSGKPIDKGVVPLMFNPFFSTKKIEQHSGLGLTFVSNIMDRHSGKIIYEEVENNPRFTLEIPKVI